MNALRYLPRPSKDGRWYVIILSGADFWSGLNKQQTKTAYGSCYTRLESRMTYCNAEWVLKADDHEIAKTLAHEYGHLLCNCLVEQGADAEAVHLLDDQKRHVN